MIKIGVVDTTFAKVDLGSFALQELEKHDVSFTKLTVPGIKDLAWACMKLLAECDGVLATGMVGKAFVDEQCSHEASQGIIAAQIATRKPVLAAIVYENEANNAAELEAICRDRVQKHAENLVLLLTQPIKLSERAGKGFRQGKEHEGPLKEEKPRIAIVWSAYRKDLTERMKQSATNYVNELGGQVVQVKCVRGSFEIPFTTQKMLERGDVDAVITLGCIVKGKTLHDEAIGFSVANKLLDLSCQYSKPVSLGIIGPGVSLEDAKERWEGYAFGAAEAAVTSVRVTRGENVDYAGEGH